MAAIVMTLCASAGPVRAADRIRVTGTAAASPAEEAVREIDDPHTGDRWLLVRNRTNPGAPGRMVLLESLQSSEAGGAEAPSQPETKRLPVIRNGDRVVIEEDTAVIDARFEAVALGPAMDGAVFNARLTVGGKVVRAVALGPGRASFAPDGERRP